LINSTEVCQFDVFIQAQKKKKYRVMQLEKKSARMIIWSNRICMYAWVYVRKFACWLLSWIRYKQYFCWTSSKQKKADAVSFPSSSKCKKTRPNIPLGLICLNNIFVLWHIHTYLLLENKCHQSVRLQRKRKGTLFFHHTRFPS
jgi:hypothetical protein